jgi:hypothetical protein
MTSRALSELWSAEDGTGTVEYMLLMIVVLFLALLNLPIMKFIAFYQYRIVGVISQPFP